MPQHVTNIGDPKNDRQLRAEFKALKAILGSRAVVGAYVDPYPDNSVSGSFLNIIGLGGMLQTLFATPDALGRDAWQLYTDFYFEDNLVAGDYEDLYDIGFDYPEGHVVARNGARYYTFFTRTEGTDVCLEDVCEDEEQATEVEPGAEPSYSGDIELRGLSPGSAYSVRRFDDGATVTATADDDGDIVLQGISFEKEVLFVVSNAG